MKEDIKDWGYCLLEILFVGALLFILPKWCTHINDEYLVEETGYIHSTGRESKCRFIKTAKERGYKISRIEKKDAIEKGYKICHDCYTKQEQEEYNEKLAKHIRDEEAQKKFDELINRKEEDLGWFNIDERENIVPSLFYVYIDATGMLHIDNKCWDLDLNGAEKVMLQDLDNITTTCATCVDRSVCDFIYKAIYEGVFDKAQIKDYEENDDGEIVYYNREIPNDSVAAY